MTSPPRKLSLTLSIGMLLVLLTLLLAYLLTGLEKRATQISLPVISAVNDFALTNQAGVAVSLANLRGKVWIADIIFTRCPGPCLKMTRQMKELQDELPPRDETKLVTLTTDPDFDSPAVLEKYAQRFNADTNRWMFLTGTKKELGALAGGSLKLTAVEKTPDQRQSENDLFIHSTIFVVVDKQARLRAVFQTGGEDVDWPTEKRKILATVKQLEREP